MLYARRFAVAFATGQRLTVCVCVCVCSRRIEIELQIKHKMPKESGKEKMPLVLVELAQGAAKDTGEREREGGQLKSVNCCSQYVRYNVCIIAQCTYISFFCEFH